MNCSQHQLPSRKALSFLALTMFIAICISGVLICCSLYSSKVVWHGDASVSDRVHALTTKWSTSYGLPSSEIAVLNYMAMLLAIASADRFSIRTRKFAWSAVTGLSIAACVGASAIVLVQIAVLEHFCLYCLVEPCSALAIAVIVTELQVDSCHP